jgi:peptidoglycan/xylan/chitin deacetylase (PgdA/CDA1 family)
MITYHSHHQDNGLFSRIPWGLANRSLMRCRTILCALWLAAIFGHSALAASEKPRDLAAADQLDAVIMIYHRFGEDGIPLTNIRTDQFKFQLDELVAGGYSVLPLSEIFSAFQSGRALPAKTVAITIDDAYQSFATTGWPMLKARGFPATLFVATDPVDQGLPGYLTWDALRALADDGVAIGHHGAAHMHMVDEGVEAARADILRASDRFREELGAVPDLFAWPYGEYGPELETMLREMGFKGAVAQYSGVAAAWDNQFSLPRFPFNENYATEDRFRLIAPARALPISDVVPRGPILQPDSPAPAYGFSLMMDIPGLSALACYPSHSQQAQIENLGNRRIEVRIDKPFPPGRSRINCTLPGPEGRWFWLGKFFYVPGSPD